MVRIDRPAVDVGPDHVSSRFLLLDQRVMVLLADALGVGEIEEEGGIAAVPDLVVHHRGLRMVAIALDQDAAAALADIVVSLQGLASDAVGAAPARVHIEMAVGFSLCSSGMGLAVSRSASVHLATRGSVCSTFLLAWLGGEYDIGSGSND